MTGISDISGSFGIQFPQPGMSTAATSREELSPGISEIRPEPAMDLFTPAAASEPVPGGMIYEDKRLVDLRLTLKMITGKSDEEIEEQIRQMQEAASPGTVAQSEPAAPVVTAAQVNVKASAEASVTVSTEAVAAEEGDAVADPLALDIDGDGEIRREKARARFDIDARNGADAIDVFDAPYLALDRDRSGRIEDGSELFGDQNGRANGFLELAQYDTNRDQVIDARDTVFTDLMLFNPREPGKLESLAESGVSAIALGCAETGAKAAGSAAQTGGFTRADGSTGLAADLLVGYRPIDFFA